MTPVFVAGLLWAAALGRSPAFQGAEQQRAPDFRVQIWGEASVEFQERLDVYAKLRAELERGLPPLRGTTDASEIVQRVRTLRQRLRAARRGAKPGDLFTVPVSAAFKKALETQANAATCAALLDDNPGTLGIGINDGYPTHKPFSTMPPNVLAVLPRLPEDVEYRMEGRHLLLLDMRARMLIDVMRSAVQC